MKLLKLLNYFSAYWNFKSNIVNSLKNIYTNLPHLIFELPNKSCLTAQKKKKRIFVRGLGI